MVKGTWEFIIKTYGQYGVPTLECHQRHQVFLDCKRYGFSHDESIECATTLEELPKIVFEWDWKGNNG